QRRRSHDVAKANERAQMMQRHLEFLLPFHIDAHGIVFQMRVSIRCHDIKCVEYLIHCVLQFVKFIQVIESYNMTTLNIRLTEQIEQRLSEEAERENKTRSEIARDALNWYLLEIEKKRFMNQLLEEART